MSISLFILYSKVFPLWIMLLFLNFGNAQNKDKVEIAILGTFHFNQVHNEDKPYQNLYGNKLKKQLEGLLQNLESFSPDQIYIEREPKLQAQIDSLYSLFKSGRIEIKSLENGSGEIYQIGFRLASSLGLSAPKCIDYYQSTSQSLLQSGDNYQVYKNALQEFQNLGRTVVGNFIQGKSSLLETLHIMNLPENVKRSHQLLFNLPAYVQKGEFSSYENLQEEGVDKQYIGIEFISLFYKRNLKIYSNILAAQKKGKAKRILCIVGQTHVGVLQELLKNNNDFKVIEVQEILNLKK